MTPDEQSATYAAKSNGRAIAPTPIQRVNLALLGVLDAHHDVAEIQQYPMPVTLALTANQLNLQLVHPPLDDVDDGRRLPSNLADSDDKNIQSTPTGH